MPAAKGTRLIRVGALTVIVGELIALVTQFETGPDSFVRFIVLGGGLIVGGALLALWGVLRAAGAGVASSETPSH
jgi:hypothetical protein